MGLFEEHWPTVGRLIAGTARKHGLSGADEEDFTSFVTIRLLEDDCAILRNFRGDAKITTYLNVVVKHFFADYCIQNGQKWHASTAAKRLGPAAIALERFVALEGCTHAEAIARAKANFPMFSDPELEALLEQLPVRQRRRPPTSIESIGETLRAKETADTLMVSRERRVMSERAASVIRKFLASLEEPDRLLLQLPFEGRSIADVGRLLSVAQKPLYRRLKQLLRDLREALEAEGITEDIADDLLGHVPDDVDFGLGKSEVRPTESLAGATVQKEVPR